ncbi:hypothetical protein Kpol_1018p176 [Vanderwaltozyma polyspora DSM 70294]|uniref:Protein YAE1 n=1 Tax=Vanderwaltozyma polyspora (strain ATCC 22028 / DSM 70294 / BCRC 21397 / CBS 2163 / NBRC 10782 / NRRL Y-8283 / UCD 57-17) TaxID=436907 RepID=YAE1_VANPO|nr:uncharacterized protein Kpol_1018p176 [Vanderwaltozyma polyspora DSM 70294]A7TE16.1 RecName: Full=Protein YAE1 [Vanderwaltozyma polyspora DSM 70294]EDO19636.1 hypothetical protein Kpol_1018p176 [Vanderwaltozyma polyspora DSM 70294]
MGDHFDDVWGSGSENESEGLTNDIKKLREIHNNRGYLDGVTDSKDMNLQNGFDEGFPTGSVLGYTVGELIGTMMSLNAVYVEDEQLKSDLESAQKELRVNEVLTKSMFNEQLDLDGEHPVLLKWKKIVEGYEEKYLK